MIMVTAVTSGEEEQPVWRHVQSQVVVVVVVGSLAGAALFTLIPMSYEGRNCGGEGLCAAAAPPSPRRHGDTRGTDLGDFCYSGRCLCHFVYLISVCVFNFCSAFVYLLPFI